MISRYKVKSTAPGHTQRRFVHRNRKTVVRRTVTVVVGSNPVLDLVAVCAFGDGAEEDLSITVFPTCANGERIEAVAVDSIGLTGINLPLGLVSIVGLIWRWYSRYHGDRGQEAKL